MDFLFWTVVAGFVGLVAGTLLGRYYVPDMRPLRRQLCHGQAYLHALIEHLTGHRQESVETLREVVEDSVVDAKPYLALGILFREGGEHDRAVRVHQSLLVRHDADNRLRRQARFELGMDFRAAGFLRRAAAAFEELLDEDHRNRRAAEQLAQTRELLEEWEGAAEAWQRAAKLADGEGERRRCRQRAAHALAEAGLAAHAAGDGSRAQRLLKQALDLGGEMAHVLDGLATVEAASGRPTEAVGYWLRALRAAPELAPRWLPLLRQGLSACGRQQELVDLLADVLREQPDSPLLVLEAAHELAGQRPPEAERHLRRLLGATPGFMPARVALGRLLLRRREATAIREDYQALLEVLATTPSMVRCTTCGVTANAVGFRCAACGEWDSLTPATGRRQGEAPLPAAQQSAATAPPPPTGAQQPPAAPPPPAPTHQPTTCQPTVSQSASPPQVSPAAASGASPAAASGGPGEPGARST